MFDCILFAFSISVDALGYSMGFGSRKICLSKLQFLLINTLNILILSLFLNIFPYVKFLSENVLLEEFGSLLLLVFGIFYLFLAYKNLLFPKKIVFLYFKRKENSINFSDLLLLFGIFLTENLFSTFVFYATLENVLLFVFCTFVFHCLFFLIGLFLGNKFSQKINLDTSFLSGTIFLLLAFKNLLA